MNKEEILKLHELSDYEQKQQLIMWDVLDSEPYDNCIQHGLRPIESLADCAFRLRDEHDNNKIHWYDAYELLERIIPIPTTGVAQPIHWIQAALLAKGETE